MSAAKAFVETHIMQSATAGTAESGSPIDPANLKAFGAAVYRSAGVPAEDAELAADTLVQADLWGHQSHGMLRLGWYYARLRSGAMKTRTECRLAVDGGAVAVLDGQDGIGQVVARRATEEAVRRARRHGVGMVSVRNSNHFGTCMYFTRMGAEQGCVMMLMSNAGPNMAPWGGLKKKIGTNPWSIATPGGSHPPVVMDMANSGVARGKIYLANNRHQPIPDHWAIDKNGNPTTDPRAALEGFILPMAGHKGYVMGVMVDVLSGVLSGSSFLDQVHGPYDPVHRSGAGHFMLALDVAAIMPPAEFHARIDAYIDSLKDVPVAPGHKQVYYPGEMETQADQENRAGGLRLAADTLADLRRVAGEAGLRWEDYFPA
jgi:LDH2 family malate/lactate/ureidoglycolate dehydrogenase